MFPDHGEVYASTLGNCASRFTPDHHSVSTTQSRLNLTVHATGQRALIAGRMDNQWLKKSFCAPDPNLYRIALFDGVRGCTLT